MFFPSARNLHLVQGFSSQPCLIARGTYIIVASSSPWILGYRIIIAIIYIYIIVYIYYICIYIYKYIIYNCTSLYMIDRTKSYKIHACLSLISALINISMPRSQVQPAWFSPLHLGLSATKHRIYRMGGSIIGHTVYPNSWMVYNGKSY